MNFKQWEQFTHADWSSLTKLEGDDVEKHYFVKPSSKQIISVVSNIESKLSINFPADLKDFYNILAPIEVFDVYFPDEEEDLLTTYRRKYW